MALRTIVMGLAAFAAATCSAPLLASDAQYCARLGPDDHVNSSGVRLNTVGAVIQQDRANYHEFGLRDRGDQDDPIFHDKTSRGALRSRIDGNMMSREDKQAILRGTPYVCVVIDGDVAFVSSVR